MTWADGARSPGCIRCRWPPQVVHPVILHFDLVGQARLASHQGFLRRDAALHHVPHLGVRLRMRVGSSFEGMGYRYLSPCVFPWLPSPVCEVFFFRSSPSGADKFRVSIHAQTSSRRVSAWRAPRQDSSAKRRRSRRRYARHESRASPAPDRRRAGQRLRTRLSSPTKAIRSDADRSRWLPAAPAPWRPAALMSRGLKRAGKTLRRWCLPGTP